jgi:ABC-type nitrate/sulfonate/bicarbonate transport system substrate-binding protein
MLITLVGSVLLALLADIANAADMVKIGATGPTSSLLPIWVSQANQCAAKISLEPQIIQIRQTNVLMAALTAGDLDFSAIPGSAIRAALSGLPVRLVAGFSTSSEYLLLSRTEIQNVGQLKGKTIAVGAPSASGTLAAQFVLRQAGLSPGRDVTLLSVGGGNDRVAALVSGRAEATVADVIPGIFAVKKFGLKVLLNVGDRFQMAKGGISATVDKIQRDRPKIVSFLRCLRQAIVWAKAHPEGAAQVLAAKMELPFDVAFEGVKVVLPNLVENLILPDSLVELEIERVRAVAKTPDSVGFKKDVFDWSLAREAGR